MSAEHWARRLEGSVGVWRARRSAASRAGRFALTLSALREVASCPRQAVAQQLDRAAQPFAWSPPIAAASLAERGFRRAFGEIEHDQGTLRGRPSAFVRALRLGVQDGSDSSGNLEHWLAGVDPALRSVVWARAVSSALGWWLAIARSGVPLERAKAGAQRNATVLDGQVRLTLWPLLRSAGAEHFGPTSFRVVVLSRDRPTGSARRLAGLVAIVEALGAGGRVPAVVWVVEPEDGRAEGVLVTSERLDEAVDDLGAVLGALMEGEPCNLAVPARPSSLCRWCPCRERCPEAAELPWRSHATTPAAVAAWLGDVGRSGEDPEKLSGPVDYRGIGE